MAEGDDEAERFGAQIDLKPVLAKARQNYEWDSRKAAYALKWYVRYLYLCRNNPGQPVAALSHAADDLWHQHIIDTRKYQRDCLTLFGQFLDHQPIYGEPKSADLAIIEQTKGIYQEAFGALPRDMKVTSGNYSYSA